MKIFSVFLIVSSLAALAPPAWGAGSVDAGRPFLASTGICRGCHTDPPTAPRFTPYRFNASGLTNAFTLIGIMNGYLSLGPQTINDIATYLGLPDSNDTDRFLDWAEDTFPQLLSPRRQVTQQLSGYTYRFYPATGIYVATRDGSVFGVDSRSPGASILNLGTLRSFLDQMPNGR